MAIVGYGFIGLGILDYLLSWMGVDITGFSLSAFIFGSIGGIFLFLGKSKDKVAEFEGSLDKGETLLKTGTLSVKDGMTNQENGTLVLTNIKLLYLCPGKSDYDFELLLEDISSVETKFPWKIIIKDKDNNEFKLQTFVGEKWKNEILKAVSSTD